MFHAAKTGKNPTIKFNPLTRFLFFGLTLNDGTMRNVLTLLSGLLRHLLQRLAQNHKGRGGLTGEIRIQRITLIDLPNRVSANERMVSTGKTESPELPKGITPTAAFNSCASGEAALSKNSYFVESKSHTVGGEGGKNYSLTQLNLKIFRFYFCAALNSQLFKDFKLPINGKHTHENRRTKYQRQTALFTPAFLYVTINFLRQLLCVKDKTPLQRMCAVGIYSESFQ